MNEFNEWFEANRESDYLYGIYLECVHDLKEVEEELPTFKQWCKDYFYNNYEL
jgi:hypothetical protein